MQGYLKVWNGIYGFITGNDGKSYFLHKNATTEKKLNEGDKLSFTVQCTGEKSDRAVNVKRIVPINWIPTREKTAYFVPSMNPLGMFRCSSCGCTTNTVSKRCPHCNVPMTKELDETYEQYLDIIIETKKMSRQEFEDWIWKKYGFE